MALSEIERLKEVYRFYAKNKTIQRRWDGNHPGNKFLLSQREKVLVSLLKKEGYFPLRYKKILDIGCGSGDLLARLAEDGAKEENLYGVDILPERIEEGRRKYPQITFQCANGEHLSFPDGFFDIIFFFTVFSSILDTSLAVSLAKEAMRVSHTGSLIIVYDVRWPNPFNPYTRPISKKLICRYFKQASMQFYSITLVPPLARLLARFSLRLCYLLENLPFLRSHYLVIIKR